MSEVSSRPIRGDDAAASNGSDGPWHGLAPDFVRATAADRLKALGHPVRLQIIEVLAGGGRNVGEIADALGVRTATASRHLRALHDARVVLCSRRGNFVLYVLADRDVARLVAVAYRGAGKQTQRLMALNTSG